MDGMFDCTEWKTPCCNAKTESYQANTYPYDSGKKCTKCGKEWSELQIARGEHFKRDEITLSIAKGIKAIIALQGEDNK